MGAASPEQGMCPAVGFVYMEGWTCTAPAGRRGHSQQNPRGRSHRLSAPGRAREVEVRMGMANRVSRFLDRQAGKMAHSPSMALTM